MGFTAGCATIDRLRNCQHSVEVINLVLQQLGENTLTGQGMLGALVIPVGEREPAMAFHAHQQVGKAHAVGSGPDQHRP